MPRKAPRNAPTMSSASKARISAETPFSTLRPPLHHIGEQRGDARVLRRQHREQHRADHRGADRRADRARELHAAADAAPRFFGPAEDLHRHLHHRHGACRSRTRSRRTAAGSQCSGRRGRRTARGTSQPHATMPRPMDGKIAVRPVRLISRPVDHEPIAMPAVSGSSSSPISARVGAAHDLQVDRHERDAATISRADAGGHRVRAPDRRLAQQLDRQQRRRARGAPAAAAAQRRPRRPRPAASDHRQRARSRSAAPAPAPAAAAR